jgi:hypothetical protein
LKSSILYIGAVLLGALAGFIDVRIGDLLFTALIVLGACMLLGALRPERPWLWAVLVGACVPTAELIAYLVFTQKPYRAQVYESFLAFLPGLVGAYGGSFGRKVIDDLVTGK